MNQEYTLSSQAVAAIMMAVQKGMMAAMENKPKEECDITSMLLSFRLMNSVDGLLVSNPPTVNLTTPETDQSEQS